MSNIYFKLTMLKTTPAPKKMRKERKGRPPCFCQQHVLSREVASSVILTYQSENNRKKGKGGWVYPFAVFVINCRWGKKGAVPWVGAAKVSDDGGQNSLERRWALMQMPADMKMGMHHRWETLLESWNSLLGFDGLASKSKEKNPTGQIYLGSTSY